MDWSEFERTFGAFLGHWSGIVYVFLIVLAVLIASAILHRVLRRFTDNVQPATHVWRDALLGSASAPLQGLVWIIGLSVAVTILTRGDKASMLAEVFPPVRNIAAIAVAAWFLLRVVGRSQRNLQARARRKGQELDATATDAIGKLLRAAIVITAILVMMQTLGFSIAGVLAFGGVGGIAVGFAAQSLVANLLGGLTVFATRPFKVGEYIIIPGTDLMGGVEHIGWRATRVIGFDRKPFFVPNAVFNTEPVINHSRMTNRRIMEYLYVRYRDIDKVRAIVADTNEMLAAHPDIEHDFFAFNFDACGDFALKMFLYAFTVSTDYTDYMNVKQDILLRIASIVSAHGAELAVPVSTVYMPEGVKFQTGTRRLADEPLAAGLVARQPGK